MTRLAPCAFAIACLAMTACTADRFTKPISMPTHGAAVRANMAAHIIDPRPPASRTPVGNSQRAVTAYQRYLTDTVKEPTAVETSAAVATAKQEQEGQPTDE